MLGRRLVEDVIWRQKLLSEIWWEKPMASGKHAQRIYDIERVACARAIV